MQISSKLFLMILCRENLTFEIVSDVTYKKTERLLTVV